MSRIRFVFGIICITISIVLWYAHPVSATDFSEYWKATYFRVVKATRSGETSGNLCLGPAEWQVHGTVGTASFTETWRVGTYTIGDLTTRKDEGGWETSDGHTAFTDPADGHGFWNTTVGVAYSFDDNCVDDDRANDKPHLNMNPTGVYGGLVTDNNTWFDSWSLSDDLRGLRSMPKKWTIQGDITLAP